MDDALESDSHLQTESHDFQFAGIHLSVKPISEALNRKATWGEPFGTSETAIGLVERAAFAQKQHGEIASFIGVGRPEKVAAQAALLHPSTLTLVDISNKNVMDALIVFAALKKGILPSELVTSGSKEALIEIYKEFFKLFPQEFYPPTDDDYLKQLDSALNELFKKMGLSLKYVNQVFGSLNAVSILRADIRAERIAETVLQATGPLVVDSSNIPLSKGTTNIWQPARPIMFSALSIKDSLLDSLGILVGRTEYEGNTIWRHDREGLMPKLPVAYSPNVQAYQSLAPILDSQAPKW